MRKSSLYSLFFTIFNDNLSWGIVLTIFAPLVFDETKTLLPLSAGDDQRNIVLGFLLSSFAFSQLFVTPFLGALSDFFGRRGVLLWSLWGSFLSFCIGAIAVEIMNLPLLFVSRIFAGAFSGNSPIAQAAISDMSSHEKKAKNLSVLGMLGGISWIVGPPLGGLLANNALGPWFTFSTPLWFVAGLFLANILWFRVSFQETMKVQKSPHHDWTQEIKDLSKLSHIPKMKQWLIALLLFYCGWYLFGLYYPTFLVQKFEFNASSIGAVSGYLAIWWFIGSFTLSKWVNGHSKRNLLIGLALISLSLALFPFVPAVKDWLMILPVTGLASSLVWIFFLAFLSNLAGAEHQGKIFGVQQSLGSFALLISPVFAGYFAILDRSLPLYIGCLFCFLPILLLLRKNVDPTTHGH